MIRKVFKTGNSLVVSIPKESLSQLNLAEGSSVNIRVDEENNQIILESASPELAGVDATFAQQVDDFIEQYRPALNELAK